MSALPGRGRQAIFFIKASQAMVKPKCKPAALFLQPSTFNLQSSIFNLAPSTFFTF
jgi:hypothetical protein